MNGLKKSINWQLISRFTYRKLFNLFQLFISYHISKITKKAIHYGMPTSISIEPTTACNLGCPECPSGLKQFSRNTGNLKLKMFESIISQLENQLAYLTLYFQGEPYINPEFLTMVKLATKKRIFTTTSTNAHFLSEEMAKKTVESGLDRLIISIDGTNQKTYENYRINGQLSKVIEGTKNIIKWKKKLNSESPQVVFQFLVVKPNEHQIDEITALSKEIGVDDLWLKTAQVYDYENGNPLIPSNEKYSRYKLKSDGTYQVKNKMENHCWRMWSSCVITWDGKVVPCCFDKDASHQLGDLKNQEFTDLWKSKPYNNFRRSVIQSRKEIDICKNCSEGTKVWV